MGILVCIPTIFALKIITSNLQPAGLAPAAQDTIFFQNFNIENIHRKTHFYLNCPQPLI
jgi:hypothetical protein